MVAGIPRNNVSTPKDEWGTPGDLYAVIDNRYNPYVDLAATAGNSKCNVYLSKIDSPGHTELVDGNIRICLGNLYDENLPIKGSPCFMNPGYNKIDIEKSMHRAFDLSWQDNCTVVCLVTLCASGWFKRWAMQADEIQIIGRVNFVGYDLEGKVIKQSPTFDSCLVIFMPPNQRRRIFPLFTIFQWPGEDELEAKMACE